MTALEEHKFVKILGWLATVTAIGMYVSYVPQIMSNLHGAKGNPTQPLVAAINCLLWVIYGLLRRDYPLAAANAPGILFGAVAFYTSL